MDAWADVRKLVRAGDVFGTIRMVTELDAAGRKAVAAELPAYVTGEARAAGWESWDRQMTPLVLAGVVCLGGPAAVASWLFRREFRWWREAEAAERVLELLGGRSVAWRADLARRMCGRLRVPELRRWGLAARLVRETGIEPPGDDAFMVGWLRELCSEPIRGPIEGPIAGQVAGPIEGSSVGPVEGPIAGLIAEPVAGLIEGSTPGQVAGPIKKLGQVADDPLFAAYVDRIFEIDALAETDLWQVVETVVRLVDTGRLDRVAVLDAVVGRLLRDGPGALVPLAGLHDRLDPDIDEAYARAGDYARLLPAGPVAVADLALAQLRRLEETGRLEEELFAEAMRALAFRPEKKLLRAAMSWAGDAVLRDAARTGTVLEALALIFAQDTLALQDRAVRLAVKLAPRAGQAAREAVRQAATELPDELRERVSAAFGGGIAAAEAPAALPLILPAAPSMPPPVASPGDLVEVLTAGRWAQDVHAFERLLAGLAEWSHRAPDELREALRPWWYPFNPSWYGHYGSEIHEDLIQTVSRAFLAFAAPEHSINLTLAASGTRRRPASPGPLDRLYLRRALELVTPFEEGTGYPVLLATPTSGTGHLDPATLLDRLELLETEGVRALPADLAQALLRLPRTFSAPEVERAGRLTSDAGRECAAWMRSGGLADPPVSMSVRRWGRYNQAGWHLLEAEPEIPASDGLPEEIRALFEMRSGHSYTLTWWPLALPGHRELAAAHLTGYLPSSMESSDGQTRALAVLTHGDGPLGLATAYALACGMSHEKTAERAAATDAFLTLAARGEVPARELGEAVTDLVTQEFIRLNRVVSVLDDATQAGAHEAVWAVITHLLPGLLPKEGERPRAGAADLLAAGARAARIAGARADLPEVAALAARKGSSRLVLEARRLIGIADASPQKSTT
ncbi:DUF7825 domain-containing protein [Nonomuraea fuscirosea]|uniref:DUF7825 domain-containing protein n=1 Tax=Nonomuraea fuscirosea TaxID=1291556 RepID=UPI0034073EC2